MSAKWLFPHRFRFLGWLVFVPSVLLGLSTMYADPMITELPIPNWLAKTSLFNGVTNNLADEFSSVGVISGLLLIAFSKETVEDEMISRLRLESLQWSVYANYLLLTIAILTVYNSVFLEVMVYNMFTVLLVFIGRFRWLLHRHTNALLTL